jgi:predicted nucleic acid-binding protein
MIFVDTSAWLALADSHDRDHPRATEITRRIAHGEFGKQVTTNYVMVETITLIRRRLGLPTALSFEKAIARSDEVRVFWIEPVHQDEALQVMAGRTDKSWSVTDCTSFVVMRALGILSAFSLDVGFRQAGFAVLP